MSYCTVNDVISLWRPLSADESTQAQKLIEICEAEINSTAHRRGMDFDLMVDRDPDLADIAKSVIVDTVRLYINGLGDNNPAMSQMSQSAGGYSVSGTFLVPGGGFLLKNSELKRLGLKRQRIGGIDLCGA